MDTGETLLLALDLSGTFAFALNGALTAMRVADVDIIGVLTLGIITAMGGGIVRDMLIDSLPPATFSDWRYLAVAAGGSLIAFFLGRRLSHLMGPINMLDAVGLSFFAVTGASKALAFGLGPAQAVILGAVTAVGGGTLRDVLTKRVPNVLRSELYAIPALIAATIVVVATTFHFYGLPIALVAAVLCFAVRMIGVRYDLNAPKPPRRNLGG